MAGADDVNAECQHRTGRNHSGGLQIAFAEDVAVERTIGNAGVHADRPEMTTVAMLPRVPTRSAVCVQHHL